MIESSVKEAFEISEASTFQQLSSGIINRSYKVTCENGQCFLLQQINTQVFPKPLDIQNNYVQIQHHLFDKKSFRLPKIIPTKTHQLLFTQGEAVWRCFEFISDTYSPSISSNTDEAWQVAYCFGKFSADLYDLDTKKLSVILPGFHDLKLRYHQFEVAVKSASDARLQQAKHLIEQAYQYKSLVDFYIKIIDAPAQYPLHILHQDCKIANILFHEKTRKVLCPVDLDTTQPGLFFSDLGDMIRSMSPNMYENATDIDEMVLRMDFYQAIKDGYLSAMQHYLTENELENIDMSGKIIVYMQALRFLTDYLNNDVYYHINYPEHNKNRAANQFKLLLLIIDKLKS